MTCGAILSHQTKEKTSLYLVKLVRNPGQMDKVTQLREIPQTDRSDDVLGKNLKFIISYCCDCKLEDSCGAVVSIGDCEPVMARVFQLAVCIIG